MHLSSGRAAGRLLSALLCTVACLGAGCHGNRNRASGYGIAWVTLTDSPGDFTSYFVNIDSIVLTRSDGAPVTALATPETVDFTKLSNYADLWGTATIPIGTYVSASIELDYTNAVIAVMVNGLPQKATVVGGDGKPVTKVSLKVTFDPANPLVLTPTFATSSAQRLALDFNLSASTASINLATSPATVVVNPYITASIAPPDNKLVRVRGPLINSSVLLGTYTVYIRPFSDERDNLGSLSIFTDANTVYTTNGVTLAGTPGLTQLSQSSAGTTVTAAYTTYTPTPTPSTSAGKYTARYVVAGSTLEDVYTQGIEGDVVARSGNSLTLRGATLQIYNGNSVYNTIYNAADSVMLVGPATLVTADDNTSLTGLSYQSVGVGQHIAARGFCAGSTACSGQLVPTGQLTFDATGARGANTGSVRLLSTNLWGNLVSSSAGNLSLMVQAINNWPIADFSFAGDGATPASDPTGANFPVNTGALVIPDTTVGDPLWIDGLVAPFGSAPPAFNASAVNSELSVQQIGAVAPSTTCGQGVLNCIPASMRVYWASPGTATPFNGLGANGMSVNLADAHFSSGVIRIGSENFDLATLPASPTIVATVPAAAVSAAVPGSAAVTVPPLFLPEYSFGVPGATAPAGINVFSVFGTFASGLTTALATTPALQFEARGTYDRATNTFYANSANVVL